MIAIIMLCMGLTLTLPDFALVIKRPLPIFIGVLAQFVIMPLGAVAVAKLLGLNPMLTIGLLMLGSVPGGTTSNVVSYLARGDVALSVTMTSVSTILSPLVTPVIMLLLAGEETPVDGKSMAWSLVQTVLLPVIGGLVIRVIFDRIVHTLLPILPWLSIVAIGGVVFPAVAARQWTNSLGAMTLLAGAFGMAASVVGALVSVGAGRVPSGPVTVLVLTANAAVALVASPKRSLLVRALRRRSARRALLRELAGEGGAPEPASTPPARPDPADREEALG